MTLGVRTGCALCECPLDFPSLIFQRQSVVDVEQFRRCPRATSSSIFPWCRFTRILSDTTEHQINERPNRGDKPDKPNELKNTHVSFT